MLVICGHGVTSQFVSLKSFVKPPTGVPHLSLRHSFVKPPTGVPHLSLRHLDRHAPILYPSSGLLSSSSPQNTGPFGEDQLAANHHDTGPYGEDQPTNSRHNTGPFDKPPTGVPHLSLRHSFAKPPTGVPHQSLRHLVRHAPIHYPPSSGLLASSEGNRHEGPVPVGSRELLRSFLRCWKESGSRTG